MKEQELSPAALAFVSLLLRLFDFLLLTQEHAESTFKEDATKRIKQAIGDRATIQESVPVSDKLTEVTPDLLIQAPHHTPVAVFLSQSATRVHEAIFMNHIFVFIVLRAVFAKQHVKGFFTCLRLKINAARLEIGHRLAIILEVGNTRKRCVADNIKGNCITIAATKWRAYSQSDGHFLYRNLITECLAEVFFHIRVQC